MKPEVSVLVCATDRLPLVRRAVASVRAQTLSDFELVLVDNASSDGTSEWGREQSSLSRAAGEGPSRSSLSHVVGEGRGEGDSTAFRYVRLESRVGPAAARNRALAEARGELVAFLDDDDLWRPRLLETLRAALAPEALVSYCDHDVIDAEDRVLEPRAFRLPRNHHPDFERITGLRSAPHLSGALIRREAFARVGAFDEGFRLLCDDVDFFYRVALEAPKSFVFVDEPLMGYRRWDASRQTAFAAGIADAESYFRAELGRWDEIDERQRERLLDVVCFHRKHAAWTERA